MKKTLLIAAAALAASMISSQAQVYSQNIVGYVNYPTPTGGNNYCMEVPFAIGVSNGANEVFGTSLQGAQDFTELLIWSPTAANYTVYQSDDGSTSGWDDGDFNPVPAPVLPVGKGFFLIPAVSHLTNTFAGAVAVAPGVMTTNTLATGGDNYLVGSAVPYAGSFTNGTAAGGGLNLNSLDQGGAADFTEVFIWSPTSASYSVYQTDQGSSSGWDDGDFNPVPPPTINVGDAFYVVPSINNVQWVQGLSAP